VLYAKQLIESGETASSAAYKVGFGDYSSFYRAYVKVIGRSPTAEEVERKVYGV
jgi:AraC-like DNA-binding protein